MWNSLLSPNLWPRLLVFSVSPDNTGSRCASKTAILIIMLLMLFLQYERNPLQQCWFKDKTPESDSTVHQDIRRNNEVVCVCNLLHLQCQKLRSVFTQVLFLFCSLKTAGNCNELQTKTCFSFRNKKRYSLENVSVCQPSRFYGIVCLRKR